jgi:hypothetical protein
VDTRLYGNDKIRKGNPLRLPFGTLRTGPFSKRRIKDASRLEAPPTVIFFASKFVPTIYFSKGRM